MQTDSRYAIGDLATLGGVSRRTVRYYVQEGLIPAPLGVGRGNHYSGEHLEQLLRVKAMQEAGQTLDGIRRALGEKRSAGAGSGHAADEQPLPRELWRRVTLAPGVELHLASGVRLPSAAKIQELASWWHDTGEDRDD
jgi:DNA-binding transcriptional MerR regulator